MTKNKKPINIYFVILPTVQLLDLTGPVQTFDEASQMGADYKLHYIGLKDRVESAQGLTLSELTHFSKIKSTKTDYIFLAGIDHHMLTDEALKSIDPKFYQWLRDSFKQGTKICTVCNSTFILAESGLLDQQKCTTHWKRTTQLQEQFPKLNVIDNCLFIKNKQLYTSAGSSAGIDLSLSIIEDDFGPLFTSKIAKELVLYMRRTGFEKQLSFYLDYRNHTNLTVHRVQDYIINHPTEKFKIEDLAMMVNISTRHLSRLFKSITDITINEFTQKLRMEIANELIKTNNYSLKEVSEKCGFENPRHFRRLLKKHSRVTLEK